MLLHRHRLSERGVAAVAMQQRHQAPLDAFGGGVGGARHRQHQPRPISPRPGDPILYVRVGRQDCGGGPPGAGDTRCNEDTRGALFLGEERRHLRPRCQLLRVRPRRGAGSDSHPAALHLVVLVVDAHTVPRVAVRLARGSSGGAGSSWAPYWRGAGPGSSWAPDWRRCAARLLVL